MVKWDDAANSQLLLRIIAMHNIQLSKAAAEEISQAWVCENEADRPSNTAIAKQFSVLRIRLRKQEDAVQGAEEDTN